MGSLSKALVLSLLIVLLYSQTNTVSTSVYTLNDQTYSYIFGAGDSTSSSTARTSTSSDVFIPDSTYTPPTTGPAPATIICPANQVYDNVLCQCVCVVGYYFAGNICVPYATVTPTCGLNQVYQNNRCVCAVGYFLIGSVCDVCPPYSTYDLGSTSCACSNGYKLVQGECRLAYVAPPVIVPVPVVCGINQQNLNGICTCLKDFYLILGVCTYCVAPNYYDPQNAICRPNCSKNQVFDINSNTCVCNGGFVNVQGQCGQCPAYSIYDKAKANCDCINGYTFNSGACIPATKAPIQNTLPV